MYKIKTLFFYFWVIFFVNILNNCTQNTNRVYFSISPELRQIIIPVHLNDSITANMVFDTGCGTYTYMLDSSFCASNNIHLNNPDTVILMGIGWMHKDYHSFIYNKCQGVRIGNVNLTYPNLNVFDWKGYYNSNHLDGMIGIPPQDTTHVWELNFEHNYLEIHPAEGFKMPENCFIIPVNGNYGYSFDVQFPMKIVCMDGDTLSMNHIYYVDTGMFYDIAVIYPAEEIEYFNKKGDAVWVRAAGGNGYSRYYTVNATLFNNISIDSLRIYTFDDPRRVNHKYLIGLNFLKRFNVFFDLKNHLTVFQPIKSFQRDVSSFYCRYHYSTRKTQDGKNKVSKIADYPGNYFKTAGLQKGDDIVAVNGLPYNNYSYDYLQYKSNTFIAALRDKKIIYEDGHFFKEDTLTYDIIRQGHPMKIVVIVDRNEARGD